MADELLDVAEALAAEVEHVAIDVPTSHVDIVTIEAGEPVAVAVAPHAIHDGSAIHVSVNTTECDADVSPYLYHSILEGNWAAVTERCRTHPEETRYVDKRTRRTPLHAACGARSQSSVINRAPAEVIYAILDAGGDETASRLDRNGNSPLQLACRDVRLWRKDPASASGSETAHHAEQVAAGQTLEQWQAVIERLLNACLEAEEWANKDGTTAVIERLLNACLEAEEWANKDGTTVLMDACEHEFVPPEVVQLLLSADASMAHASDMMGKSALAKYGEANGKCLAVARLLLDACPESLLYQDSDGRTPLHRPSFEGNVNLVESMLLRDESVASIRDNKGLLPLHRACQCTKEDVDSGTISKAEVIRLLLDAYPEGCMACDIRGCAPIHFLAKRNPDFDIFRSIYNAEPNCLLLQDNLGWTALHNLCSLSADCDELVMYLLEVNPNLAKIKTKKGDTALHVAADANPSALVAQKLVELYPDAITARNDYGYTPLHVACRAVESSVSFISILYGADSDVMTMRTNSGELPIHLICQQNQVSPDVLALFLETIPSDHDVNLPRSGHNPLHEACLRRLSLELIEIICNQKPSWVTAKNLQGRTPLHLLCKISRGAVDMGVMQTLVRVGGAWQIKEEDEYSYTPFLSALREDASLPLIAFLLRACPEAVIGHHKSVGTPLEYAVIRDVPTAVLSAVATAGDASYITLPHTEGFASLAPLETIMYKVHGLYRSDADHSRADFSFYERLHRAFLLVSVALGRSVNGESGDEDGVTTSISLLDLLSLRRKFGSEYVALELINHVLETARALPSPVDAEGNTPLHIEVAVSQGSAERRKKHFLLTVNLLTVLGMIIDAFPTNLSTFNDAGELPFDVMIRSDRSWASGIAVVVKEYPQALTAWLERQKSAEHLLPALLKKVSKHCGIATTFHLLRNMPKFAAYHK